jgi:hypothetical protein
VKHADTTIWQHLIQCKLEVTCNALHAIRLTVSFVQEIVDGYELLKLDDQG